MTTCSLVYGSSAGAIAAVLAAVWVWLGGGSPGHSPAAQAQGPPAAPSSAAAASPPAAGRPSAATIPPATPAGQELRRETTQPAHLESYERTDVYAKASGFLKSVQVDIGDRVLKDQLLAELWIPEMEQELQQKLARVEQARAVVEQMQAQLASAAALVAAAEAQLAETRALLAAAEAEVEYRRSEHGRMAALVASRTINEALQDEKLKQLRSAEANLVAAQARIQSMQAQLAVERTRHREAEANLAHAQSQLQVAQADREQTSVLMQYAQVRAPYDGIVTHRRVDTGDFVTSAATTRTEPLFTVERVDRLRIIFDVPESESSLVAVGQPTTLHVDALKGRSFPGRVKRTAGVLDARTRTLRVEAELDEPQPSLRPGMYGMITVTFATNAQSAVAPTR